MVTITWHGHSFFEIVSQNGFRILVDPHDGGSLNLERPKPGAPVHVILVTHDHFDHNAVKLYAGDDTRVYIARKGLFSLDGIEVRGVRLPHDEAGGRHRGHVTAYKILVDGISITHLGDVGTEKLDEDIVELLRADIVMIPVGGTYTIGPAAALYLAEKLKPKLLIPMHFWVPGITLPLEPVDSFLDISKYRRLRVDGNSVMISPEDLPDKTSIVIFRL